VAGRELWVQCPDLRPEVDRFEELLRWAEERATANGITPPYRQEGFVPDTVAPLPTSDGAGPSDGTAGGAPELSGRSTLDLKRFLPS
jgi:hypothetical protein